MLDCFRVLATHDLDEGELFHHSPSLSESCQWNSNLSKRSIFQCSGERGLYLTNLSVVSVISDNSFLLKEAIVLGSTGRQPLTVVYFPSWVSDSFLAEFSQCCDTAPYVKVITCKQCVKVGSLVAKVFKYISIARSKFSFASCPEFVARGKSNRYATGTALDAWTADMNVNNASLQSVLYVLVNSCNNQMELFLMAWSYGHYGSVYKGVLREGNLIAVKVLNLKEPGASKNFVAECEALRVARHRNLLKIHTVCSSVDFSGNDFKALVFEFMSNGNLHNWLHQCSDQEDAPRSLNFPQRLNIAIDVASGLDYLHNQCEIPIVHCDLKSSNILVDDELTAHVADFGLSKFLPTTNATNTLNNTESTSISIRGTIGYIPPEYGAGGKVSAQGDVYSFGILLLEMFTGKRPTDHIFQDGLNIHDFSRKMLPQRVMEIVDARMLSEIHDETSNSTDQLKECFSLIVGIGIACSVDSITERLSIRDALKELLSIKRSFFSGVEA